jgi:hypothetical protein
LCKRWSVSQGSSRAAHAFGSNINDPLRFLGGKRIKPAEFPAKHYHPSYFFQSSRFGFRGRSGR